MAKKEVKRLVVINKCAKRHSFLNKEIKRDSVKSLVEMV